MSGLLKCWLDGEDWPTTLKYANACGAFAVSRHGCAPAIPSWTELEGFLRTGSEHRRLREDARLEQVHWATNRKPDRPQVLAMAFDHRAQFEEMAERATRLLLERVDGVAGPHPVRLIIPPTLVRRSSA